jgi:hypothetical protein
MVSSVTSMKNNIMPLKKGYQENNRAIRRIIGISLILPDDF